MQEEKTQKTTNSCEISGENSVKTQKNVNVLEPRIVGLTLLVGLSCFAVVVVGWMVSLSYPFKQQHQHDLQE